MSQPCEFCHSRGNGDHYDHLSHRCFNILKVESPPSSSCCHLHSHRPATPNYCTSHDPSSPGRSCSCQSPPTNHIHGHPSAHLHTNYYGAAHSPIHHCGPGSCRHLPSVASPLHYSQVNGPMVGTSPMMSSSDFHTPTQRRMHYNGPSQSHTPQGSFAQEKQLPSSPSHCEHHHTRPTSQGTPDHSCSCLTTPTSCHKTGRLPKPELMLDFSPDTHTQPPPRMCFEMGVDVHSGVVPTPMVSGRTTSCVNSHPVSNIGDTAAVVVQQEETPQLQAPLAASGSSETPIDSSQTRSQNTSPIVSPWSGRRIRQVTPCSVHVNKIKVSGKEKEQHGDVIEVADTDGENDTLAYSVKAGSQQAQPVQQVSGQKCKEATDQSESTSTTASTNGLESQQALQTEPSEGVKGTSSAATSSKKTVMLRKWSFSVVPGGYIILYGLKDQDTSGNWWRSGPIVECITPTLLTTKSGSLYHLMGKINSEEMLKTGMWRTVTGKKILKKFSSGFPRQWESLIQELHSVNIDGERQTQGQKSLLPVCETPTLPVSLKDIKLEPGEAVDSSLVLSSFKRSSRGRIIKPMLNNSPFSYSYDMHGNLKGLSSPVIDLTIDENEGSELTQTPAAVRVQKEMEPLPVKKLPKKTTIKKEQLKSKSCDSESDAPSLSSSTKRRRTRRVVLTTKTRTRPKEPLKTERTDEGTSQSSDLDSAVELKTKKGNVSLKAKEKENSESEVVIENNDSVPPRKTRGRKPLKQHPVEARPQTQVEVALEIKKVAQARKRTRSNVGKKVSVLESSLHSDNEVKETDDSQEEMTKEPACRVASRRSTRVKAPVIVVDMEEESEDNATVTKPKRNAGKRKVKQVDRAEPSTKVSKGLSNAEKGKGSYRTKRNKSLAVEQQPKRGQRRTVSWNDDLSEEESIKWTQANLKRLKQIVYNLPALTPNFWEVVATRLDTGHTATECSSQYFQITKKSTKDVCGASKNTRSEAATAITAKEGTMKRKRQLRSALEQMDVGYSDDIFDATPYKKKLKHVQEIELSDDECFNDLESDSDSETSYTPNETRRRRVGAPSVRTPKLCDYLTTPDLKSGLKRDAADNVIYKIQKAKKTQKQKQPVKKKSLKSERKHSSGGAMLSLDHLYRIRSGERTTLRLIEDSDDESSSGDSNPFSDVDETYENIMRQLH